MMKGYIIDDIMVAYSRFTQEELEAAYEQMRKEREVERNKAVKVANWLANKIGLDVRATCGDWSCRLEDHAASPYSINYKIIIHYDYRSRGKLEQLKELTSIS